MKRNKPFDGANLKVLRLSRTCRDASICRKREIKGDRNGSQWRYENSTARLLRFVTCYVENTDAAGD
jgi:hypothetical protein